MSNLQTTCEGVRAALAAASLGATLTVARKYDPDVEVSSLTQLATGVHVTVVGKSTTTERTARRELEDTHVVDIGIRALLPQDYESDADALAELARKIQDFWWDDTIEGMRLRTAETPTPWSPSHLSDHQVWLSVVTLTFTQTRAIPVKGA